MLYHYCIIHESNGETMIKDGILTMDKIKSNEDFAEVRKFIVDYFRIKDEKSLVFKSLTIVGEE